jgi:hypothetical protein
MWQMAEKRLRALIESRYDSSGSDKAKQSFSELADSGDKTSTGLERASRAVGNFDGLVTKLISGGILLKGASMLINFGRAGVSAASDVEEMASKFNVVFGESAPQAAKELERFGEAVNRSKFNLKEMASTVQDTFVPLGFARDEAAKLSVELVKLATDVASFNNVADADVLNNFQSALVGNHMAVQKYSIVINEARIQQELQRMGMVDLTGEALEQAKVMARLNLIIDGTSDTHGDAARTADSYANMQKGLKKVTEELTVAIGQGLIPMMKDVTRANIALTQSLVAPAQAWALLMQAVDEGLITQTEANVLWWKIVWTSKTAVDVLEELGEKFDLIDQKAKASTGTYNEMVKATVALAYQKRELSRVEREVLLAHTGVTEASSWQAKGFLEHADAVQELYTRLGLLTRAQFDLLQTIAPGHGPSAEMAEARRQLEELAVARSAMQREELKRAFDDLQTAVADPLGRADERFSARQRDILMKIEELRRGIAELESLDYLTSDQEYQLELLRHELGLANQAVADNAAEWDRATKEILFNLAVQTAATMENKQVAYDLLASIVEAWELAGQSTVDAIRVIGEAFNVAERDADRARQMILSLGDAARSVEGDYQIRFYVDMVLREDPRLRDRELYDRVQGLMADAMALPPARPTPPAAPVRGVGGAGRGISAPALSEPEIDPIQQAFRLMGAYSSVGDIAAERLRSRIIDPLKKEIETIEALIRPDFIDITARERLVELENQRAEAIRRVAMEEERILEFQRKQQDLRFLEQQVKLLELIQEHELDRMEILGGLKLGIEADEGKVLDAMTKALDAMIRETERKLGIASPSTVYRDYGRNIPEALAMGIDDTRRMVEMARDRMLEGALLPQAGLDSRGVFGGKRINIERMEIIFPLQSINSLIDWDDGARRVAAKIEERLS